MKARFIATANMVSNAILGVDIFHYSYNQHSVAYDAALTTYEFSTYRGEMKPNEIATPTMKGR